MGSRSQSAPINFGIALLQALKALAVEFAMGTLVTLVIIMACAFAESPRAYERRTREG